MCDVILCYFQEDRSRPDKREGCGGCGLGIQSQVQPDFVEINDMLLQMSWNIHAYGVYKWSSIHMEAPWPSSQLSLPSIEYKETERH